jgi:hypothetical protein
MPLFQEFMKTHSELGGLFNLPGNYGSLQAVVGLQSRDQVQQAISSQLGNTADVQQILGRQVQSAKSQLDVFKQKLNALGANSGDIDMPNFRSNEKKTKPFLKRLEYGMNTQSTKSGYFFPSTTDVGLSIGYMLNAKNIIGIGGSYKIGWGRDIKHVSVTSQGMSLRSFLDINIKQSFYASGGFEYNYQQPFNGLRELYSLNNWQQSGLLGVTKVVAMKSSVLKKTKLQLLWDFLSYRQIPRTQALKFRVGYNF